jgi:protein-S-isoprenylcysteine O-methyltransferase Ste14
MKQFIKQLVSFILPVLVLVIVPLSVENDLSIHSKFAMVTGLLIMSAGLFIMEMTISSFIRIGKGTLAPWSPTRKLVLTSLYKYVRNPMILGVLTVLIGEAISILSVNILIWAIIFFIINNLWFVLFEEPDLEKRFGEEYKEYKRNVPRWIPRTKPFSPDKT